MKTNHQPPTTSHQPLIANAILGIDTLWGGDVMCPSGTGRFIADSWFSDEPLPPAYTHPAAARVRDQWLELCHLLFSWYRFLTVAAR